jgi:hypothetical protein
MLTCLLYASWQPPRIESEGRLALENAVAGWIAEIAQFRHHHHRCAEAA